MTMVRSANWFNYINLAQTDNSGMLRFLTDELQDAEDQGDRGMTLAKLAVLFSFLSLTLRLSLVWIIGHVLSGWDGTNALEAPSNLCEYHAFMVLFTRLVDVFHHSLSDVSPIRASLSRPYQFISLRYQCRPLLPTCYC